MKRLLDEHACKAVEDYGYPCNYAMSNNKLILMALACTVALIAQVRMRAPGRGGGGCGRGHLCGRGRGGGYTRWFGCGYGVECGCGCEHRCWVVVSG